MTDQFKKAIENAAIEMNKLNEMDIEAEVQEELVVDLTAELNEMEEPKEKKNIRFLMYKVVDGDVACKVWYMMTQPLEGEEYITIYSESYGRELHEIFGDAINNSDSMTDYFEKSRVKITKSSPYWNKVKAAYDKKNAADKKRSEKRMAKFAK